MKKQLFSIIFENEDFVAVDKSSGLLSIPDRDGDEVSLKRILKDKYGEIYTVHRLDKDTSGIIVFAKNEATHRFLSRSFEERSVEKYYEGLVKGTLHEKEKTIDAPIAQNTVKKTQMIIHKRGKESVTDYKVLEEFGKFTLLEFRIHTGRTHQIRVHMQYVGHPIVCDGLYGDGEPVLLSSLKKKYNLSKNELEERPLLNRLALHAARLKFKDANGNAFTFGAPLPKDMSALLQQLRKLK
ncbi:MAG: RluA family pseudouridine synthase [Chitinophagaceae bacterium]|nr:RluA family pseudouridine synthase [Chitinophagaceae bacterium]